MTSLPCLPRGCFGHLVQVDGDRSFRRRLMEMGLLPGTRVRLLRCSDVHDLVEIVVRGCHLTLRSAEANRIFVEPEAA
ncbi:MAG: ferrous iron transport protein A [Planctomycetes bacterium]|nr:ferrous iron transport protein A [Planctomycetota bacterium]MCB9912891.1 ferrous iron transport protein A [Planctomycetota bacterium]HPF14534.1 FeoA family protein [Planctomycetota bacterium]